MPVESADALVGLTLLTLLAVGAYTDLRSRRIGNRVSAGILALWVVHLVVTSRSVTPLLSVAVGLAVLAAAIPLWQRGLLGGGDVKLIAVLSVWAGPPEVVRFILVTALAGGVLALVFLWHRRTGWLFLTPIRAAVTDILPIRFAAPATTASTGIPYGVAIATGGSWLWLQLFAA